MRRIATTQKILFVLLFLWVGTLIITFNFHDAIDSAAIEVYGISGESQVPRAPRSTRTTMEDGEGTNQFPKELGVTLLNWKRRDCVQTIIHRLQDYRGFITEILIGNNNPDVVITAEEFDSPFINLRVINFPQNRFFYARYELCLMVAGKYCYFQDDDRENRHLRSLYANFLRYPHLLHTFSDTMSHYLTWAWTFFEPSVNMHTGFSWVGTGSIVSKENVHKFTETQVPLLPRESVNSADMYFSIWFNQVPYQLENAVTALEHYNDISGPARVKRNKFHINEGVLLLYNNQQINSICCQQS
jgi:hypothetical protein